MSAIRAKLASPTLRVVQAGRFVVVGTIQNAVNIGTFAIMINVGVAYRVAAAISAFVALVLSFCLNRWWTFQQGGPASLGQFTRYAGIFVAATVAGIALLSVFVELAGLPRVLAQAMAMATIAPLSYALQRALVFHGA